MGQPYRTISYTLVLNLVLLLVGLMPPTVDMRPNAPVPDLNDMEGRSFKSNAPPNRVVSYAPIVEPYVTINRGIDHLFAVPSIIRARALGSLLSKVYPAVIKLLITGNTVSPDPEFILYCQPDYVFTVRGRGDQLRQIGYRKLIEINYEPMKEGNSFARAWNLIGSVSGMRERASRLIKKYNDEMLEIRSISTAFQPGSIRVLLLNRFSGSLFVGGLTNDLNHVIESAGGINPVIQYSYFSQIGFEGILALDPTVIIVVSQDKGATIKELLNQPQLQPLKAMRQRMVYLMPSYSGYNSTIDEPLLLSWMLEILRSNTMPLITRDMYRRLYHESFQYDLSDEEIDEALRIPENSQSYGYERFVAKRYE